MFFLIFAGLALLLGLKHSFDSDHLAAVSGFFARKRARPARLGLWWALGHSVTASLLALLFWIFRESFAPVAAFLSYAAPAVLIGSGALGVYLALRPSRAFDHDHEEPHAHAHDKDHSHKVLAGIGALHGLASNDELLVILVASLAASTPFEALAGVLFFSAGVALGMMAYAVSVRAMSRAKIAAHYLPLFASFASIGYGVALLFGLQPFNLFG